MRSLPMPKVGLSRQLAPELGGKIRKTPGRSFEIFAARLTLYDFVPDCAVLDGYLRSSAQ